MGQKPRLPSNLWKARLSRRIVFWVFLSIVVIEAIILVPSVIRRERELLEYLRSLSAAQAEGVLSTKQDLDETDDATILGYLETLQHNRVVLGGTLYRADGTLVGSFGEAPELGLQEILGVIQRGVRGDHYNRRTQRYDALWEMSPLKDRYQLIIRHDATWVGREFYHFIARIAGLVLIISVFVTGATMIVLERIVIAPVLALRRDLRRAGETLSQNQDARSLPFESMPRGANRQDELGEVIVTFEEMVNQVGEAITERNQAATELRLSEEKFSKSFYASPNPMSLSILENGQLLDVNNSFLNLYQADREAIIGKTSIQLGLWANPEDRANMLIPLRADGFLCNQEYRFRTLTGDLRTVLFSAETVKLNGQCCILAVMNDITERKAAEEALRESEQRFRTLVEQATDALFVVNTNGCFLDVNQEACHTLGYARDELLKLSVPDIQKAVSMVDLEHDWTMQPGQSVTREGIHQRKDGSQFPVEVRLGRIEIGGRAVLLALARDITARKQMEKAQARLAEIGELAAMIVHEVRNPLTTVLMGLHAFEQMDLPERARMRLAFALEESERLQRLLNEILMYAREQLLDLEPLAIGEFLQKLCDEFCHQPVAADRIIHTTGFNQLGRVKGDRDRLKQVVINLLSNACEAVVAGETITCSLVENTKFAILKVHNGGAPIPPEILPKLSQPFFTTKSSGNGLGLAITRRIVEAHHGTFSIASSAETGTTVTVQIPLHRS
ncbi:MAG: PAS domain S-box protein [Leptolyngbya sp. SIO1E4]|nr:PAS domain S-box protein [Leptolyngbya sp. SIO1E4]